VLTIDEDRNGNGDPTDDFTEDPDGQIPDYLYNPGRPIYLPLILK
jgi:hypothetical protein